MVILRSYVPVSVLAELYEELLIESKSQPTAHPLIYRAEEKSLSPDELAPIGVT